MLQPPSRLAFSGDERLGFRIQRTLYRNTSLGKDKSLIAFAVSGDSKRFATVASDNILKVWDISSGKDARTWDLHYPGRPFVKGLTFSADSKQIITANADSTVYVLDCP